MSDDHRMNKLTPQEFVQVLDFLRKNREQVHEKMGYSDAAAFAAKALGFPVTTANAKNVMRAAGLTAPRSGTGNGLIWAQQELKRAIERIAALELDRDQHAARLHALEFAAKPQLTQALPKKAM